MNYFVELLMKNTIYKKVGCPLLISVAGCVIWAIISNYIGLALTSYLIDVSSSFSNKIYISVSSHDLIALQQSTYFLLSMMALVFTILISGGFYVAFVYSHTSYQKSKETRFKDITGLPLKTEEVVIKKETPPMTNEEFVAEMRRLDKIQQKLATLLKILSPITMICFVLASGYTIITTKYIYESISYYDYLLKVNALNLDDITEKSYMSRFTQIHNKQDYTRIVEELESRALQYNLSFLPNPTVRDKEELLKAHPGSKSINWDEVNDKS